MFKVGIIELLFSVWSVLIVLVIKKDGSIWYCIDYWKFNEVM